ncbi:effector-associated constant component EACC1 [Micromonospora chalcea]|uniref:effector-associated constant component EACC1 n=1 Tax=Micromonospora chalcea TaxID=1874 RepID=UPI0011B0C38E|nr:hypothetical protein [Micromonospora chalcea]
MRAAISLTGPESAWEANSLASWLRDDPQLRRYGHAELAPPAVGSMGAGEVVTVVLTQLAGVVSLVTAYLQWRQAAHRQVSGARLRVGKAEIELDEIRSLKDYREPIEQFLQRLKELESEGPGLTDEAS